MLILFDHSTPAPLSSYLIGHTVIAERAGFEVFVTADNSIAYQQNMRGRQIAIVLINRNRWRSVLRVIHEMLTAVNEAKPGSYTVVDVPIR